MAHLRLSAIGVYPLKSAGGLSPREWSLDALGLVDDRRWMLVDPEGKFVTARTEPRMALLRVAFSEDRRSLWVRAAGMEPLSLTRPLDLDETVEIWGDSVNAASVGPEADRWFSAYLARKVRAVYIPPHGVRQVDPRYARPGDRVGFADGFPALLVTDTALDELNSRLRDPLTMARFRPNLVISGAPAHAEDGWRRVRIGAASSGVEFDVVKPCARCTMTTIDPETAVKGREPLKTLAGYRRDEASGQVMFGQNVIHRGVGELRVGDPVTVLETVA